MRAPVWHGVVHAQVRSKLDALLSSKIDSPELDVGEAGKELLAAVSQVLSTNM